MYEDYLSINTKFKASVNLQYDLYNEEKLLQYIPTTDLCDVIKKYAKSVLGIGSKSTLLAGPYGKGKSYLSLILSFLFSNRNNKQLFKKVIGKIKLIDKELYSLLVEIDKRGIALMPVIINSAMSSDVNQAFMIALNNALNDHDIHSIVPQSAFSECISLLEKWEESSNGFDILNICRSTLKIDLSKLKFGLQNYDLSAYSQFEKLFSCVSHGYSFNPLISNDIGKIYSDVAIELNKYGYTGLFVIFDEFGVFLENQEGDFSTRLNKIQSFAEKCDSFNQNSQMMFCCITHKDISLYENKNKAYHDEFEKIAGRFLQIRFDRSLDENNQIICQALEKKAGYKDFVNSFKKDNQDFINRIKLSKVFYSDKMVDYLIENGLPINPITLYILVQVSEKVAQNERTLFTFISDKDIHSLTYFIANNNSGLLNATVIYDYFEKTIANNAEYKNIYYKVEALNRLSVKDDERSIFKSLALIKIVDDELKFNASINNISLCLGKSYDDVSSLVESLISKNLLKRNLNDSSIDFAVLSDSAINSLIDTAIIKNFSSISLCSLLNQFDINKYFVSNEYNYRNQMTRYYNSMYLESSAFIRINDIDILYDNNSDGLVLNLIDDDYVTDNEILNKVLMLNKKNLIVRHNDKSIEQEAIIKLKRIFASKYLLSLKSNLSESASSILPVFIEDLTFEVNNYLKTYLENSKIFSIYNPKKKTLQSYIHDSLSNCYDQTIPFNNEQVNKTNVSTVTCKARNQIVDDILLCERNDYKTSSQEYTIRDSFEKALYNRNSDTLLKLVESKLLSCSDNRIDAVDVISMMKGAPFGMRIGIIPLYLAYAISRISVFGKSSINAVLLYNENYEIEINADNLSKVVSSPLKYKFGFTKINKDKLDMLNLLLSRYDCINNKSFSDSLTCLLKKLKYDVSNLSPVIIKSTSKDNVLNLSIEELSFKDLLIKHDLNNYEVIFDSLPSLLNSSYSSLPDVISGIFNSYEIKIRELYDKTIFYIKDSFKVDAIEIKSCFDLWKSKHGIIEEIVFDYLDNKIYKALQSIQFNNYDAINVLSYAILNCTLDDWSDKKLAIFYESFNAFINKVESYNSNVTKSGLLSNDFNNYAFSNLGKTLISNIKETIDEYGNSLSNEEKVAALQKLLHEYID